MPLNFAASGVLEQRCPEAFLIRAGRKLLCGGGGGVARKPICSTPPSPSLVAVPGGGFGLGLPYLPCRGGGGVQPQHKWLKMIPTSH